MESLQLVLLTCAVSTHEGKDVSITDIPGAYLITDTDKMVVIVLRGALADLITLMDPVLYWKYIVVGNNVKPILYLKLQMSL